MSNFRTSFSGKAIDNLKSLALFYMLPLFIGIISCKSIDKPRNEGKKLVLVESRKINTGLIPEEGNLIACSSWTEFATAVKTAEPGDVIQLKNGTYSGSIKFSNSGTSEKPVTIIPESRGKVIINGNSEWEIDGEYITVDGFYFSRGTSTHPVQFSLASKNSKFLNSAIVGWNLGGDDTRLITIRGSQNEVGHCVIREKNTPGMMLEVVRESSMRNDHKIHHIYFGYFKDPGSGNGYETVRISTSHHSLSSSYTTLESCVFEQCNGESEIISSKSGHNTFRNNTFLNSDGALTLRHGHDALVEGNYFINTLDKTSSRCNGVRVIGERHTIMNNYFFNLPMNAEALQVQYGNQDPHKLTQYDQVKNAVIESNTFYNCDAGVHLGSGRRENDDPPRIMAPNGSFRDNLIVSSKGDNYSLLIEEELLSKNLFSYEENIISGKPMTKPPIDNLPEGVRFVENVEMVEGVDGLYWPQNEEISAGSKNRNQKPLYAIDIVPEWVKLRMEANDPDFIGNPW